MTKTAEWRLHVEKWVSGGLSAETFAEQHGLTVKALKWWHWKIGDDDARTAKPVKPQKQALAAFAEIVVAAPVYSSSTLEVLLPTGHVVRVAADFDEAALLRLLTALARLARS